MVKTKTKIEKQLGRKSNEELVSTIIAAKKKEKWLPVADMLAGPRRMLVEMNLDELDRDAKEGETVVVPGKILSHGEMNKKVKIVAFKFSGKAKEKLLKSKIQVSTIEEEIKKNPEAKGVRIITK